MMKIKDLNNYEYYMDKLPDKCPFCHKSIIPHPITVRIAVNSSDVFMSCPNSLCNSTFIAYYQKGNSQQNANRLSYLERTSFGNIFYKKFSEIVERISIQFVNIYNEAYAAEQFSLLEISGVGYRKALEFLIKDYAILNNYEKKAIIEKQLLGQCIANYINEKKIQDVAKRATWLGNDETHYVRKWESKSLKDLKKLIELTTRWIEIEELTKEVIEDMPETK